MPNRYKKILIINTFGIGDVLFSTPMIRALKAHIPGASIDAMCNERGRYVLQHNRDIDRIIIFEKDDFRDAFRKSKLHFVRKLFKFIKEIKRGKYDLAIDLSLGHQISMLLKILGIKKRIGFNYRNRGRFLTDKSNMNGFNGKHVVEHYLDILKLIGIREIADKNLKLSLSPELEQWADSFLSRYALEHKRLVGLAPGGGKSWGEYAIYRRWDPANFAYLAERLSAKRKDIYFLIFGSSEEKEMAQSIEKGLAEKSTNLCGKVSLPEAIALIKKCALLLCNDGGLLHIAVSQGERTVSIFGPVDDKVYGPYPPSGRHKVVKAEDVACRPCYKNFKHKMCQTHDCLKKIDKDKVLKLAEESLEV
ncbi:MAG: lipopolysaccharide heptosyltransferase II [Candidatus Omnitrophota bacterium]